MPGASDADAGSGLGVTMSLALDKGVQRGLDEAEIGALYRAR